MRNYDDELEDQRLRYAANEGLCPDCCTELIFDGINPHDSFLDNSVCPKCGWHASVWTLVEYKDEQASDQRPLMRRDDL